MKNCTKFEGKILSSHICQKCDSYLQKTCCWCQISVKFCTPTNYLKLKKTPKNNFFIRGQQHCENGIPKFTNIHKIFAKYFNTYNQFLGLHIQLVPKKIHIFPAAYLNCNWLCCKLPISSWPYSTSPQKYIKSETGQKTIPKYSVWNNYTRRKWVLWWKNSYFPFSIEPDT